MEEQGMAVHYLVNPRDRVNPENHSFVFLQAPRAKQLMRQIIESAVLAAAVATYTILAHNIASDGNGRP